MIHDLAKKRPIDADRVIEGASAPDPVWPSGAEVTVIGVHVLILFPVTCNSRRSLRGVQLHCWSHYPDSGLQNTGRCGWRVVLLEVRAGVRRGEK